MYVSRLRLSTNVRPGDHKDSTSVQTAAAHDCCTRRYAIAQMLKNEDGSEGQGRLEVCRAGARRNSPDQPKEYRYHTIQMIDIFRSADT